MLRKGEAPSLYQGDVTQEALIVKHIENPRGLIILPDEMTSFLNGMNQYKGGRGNDRQFWLKAYDGGDLKTLRKARDPVGGTEELVLYSSCISILGGIQPSELKSLTGDGQKSTDGFAPRFLICFPDSKPQFYTMAGIPQSIISDYDRFYNQVFDYAEQKGTVEVPFIIALTDEARDFFLTFVNKIVIEVNEGDLLPGEKESFLKMRGQILKFALILHVCKLATGETSIEKVTKETMVEAGTMAMYFLAHTKKTYHSLRGQEKTDNFKEIMKIIKDQGGKTTARDIQRTNKFGKSDQVKYLLNLLIKDGTLEVQKEGRAKYYCLTREYYQFSEVA